MKKSIRLLFQCVIWAIMWSILWAQQSFTTPFLVENYYVFIFQIILIAFLVYYAAPAFLNQKKYLQFIVISGVVLLVANLMMSFLSISSIPKPRHLEPIIDFPRNPPSRIFIQSLLLILAYILTTIIEIGILIQKKEEEIIVSKNENLQTELKLLKSQINPHFLFNSLNNIYALSAIDAAKTQQSISYLSDMLRYVLYDCEKPLVPIEKEVAYIKNYIQLFSLKTTKKYPIALNINLINPHFKIAPMVLIPFVENAFKHSSIEKIKDVYITINLTTTDNELTFKIENSILNKHAVKDEVGGIGLENVKRRLSILYPNKHELNIQEFDDRFKVSLKIKHHEV